MDRGLGADQASLDMVETAACEVAGRATGLAAGEVREALDPVRSVASRSVPGGPAPEAVRRLAGSMLARLEQDEAQAAGWRDRIVAAAAERQAAVRALSAGEADAPGP